MEVSGERRWWSPRLVAFIVIAYLAIHAATRLMMGPVLGMDDAEQTLFAQHLNWGYRIVQPPLFTWIYVGLGNLIGFGIVAATIMRYSLMGLCALFLYLTARELIPDRRLAALSLYSFGLIYVFAVYAHHDLTHTTILATVIAATLLTICRLAANPSWGWYAVLGVCIGLGILSKWNYVMLPLALAVAALVHSQTRGLVLTYRIVGAIIPAVLILAGPMLWILANSPDIGAASQAVLAEGAAPMPFTTVLLTGTISYLEALLAFPQPLLVLFAAIFGPGLIRRHRSATGRVQTGPWDLRHRLLLRMVIAGVVMHWLLVPVFGAVTFNERWMHTVLMPAPLLAFAFLACYPPSRRALRIFIGILIVVTITAWAGLVIRHALGADACGSCRTLTPIPELAEQIADDTGFSSGTIVTNGFHLGGNLRVAFPDARIIDITYPAIVWPEHSTGAGACLAIWTTTPSADDASAPPLPGAIAGRLEGDYGADPGDPVRHGQVEALMHGSERRVYALGYALFQTEEDNC